MAEFLRALGNIDYHLLISVFTFFTVVLYVAGRLGLVKEFGFGKFTLKFYNYSKLDNLAKIAEDNCVVREQMEFVDSVRKQYETNYLQQVKDIFIETKNNKTAIDADVKKVFDNLNHIEDIDEIKVIYRKMLVTVYECMIDQEYALFRLCVYRAFAEMLKLMRKIVKANDLYMLKNGNLNMYINDCIEKLYNAFSDTIDANYTAKYVTIDKILTYIATKPYKGYASIWDGGKHVFTSLFYQCKKIRTETLKNFMRGNCK